MPGEGGRRAMLAEGSRLIRDGSLAPAIRMKPDALKRDGTLFLRTKSAQSGGCLTKGGKNCLYVPMINVLSIRTEPGGRVPIVCGAINNYSASRMATERSMQS